MRRGREGRGRALAQTPNHDFSQKVTVMNVGQGDMPCGFSKTTPQGSLDIVPYGGERLS